MKTPVLYTYAGCESCRRALKWLREEGIVFVEKPIRETPPTPAELRAMIAQQGGELRRLFNTSGKDYRDQKLGERLPTMSEVDAIKLLATNGNLVKRPFFLGEDFGLVGFKPEVWERALG